MEIVDFFSERPFFLTLITRRVIISISMVATVMKTHAIIVMIFPLNFALIDMQIDMIMLRKSLKLDKSLISRISALKKLIISNAGKALLY